MKTRTQAGSKGSSNFHPPWGWLPLQLSPTAQAAHDLVQSLSLSEAEIGGISPLASGMWPTRS
eukprot:495194-Amphidinium_carterae.1